MMNKSAAAPIAVLLFTVLSAVLLQLVSAAPTAAGCVGSQCSTDTSSAWFNNSTLWATGALNYSSSAAGGAWYWSGLERSFLKGVQPFDGNGQHLPSSRLVWDARTQSVYTGSANRSTLWQQLIRQVRVNESGIRVWSDRPVPLAVQQFIDDGLVDDSISNDTYTDTNDQDTCSAAHNGSVIKHGGRNCKVVPGQWNSSITWDWSTWSANRTHQRLPQLQSTAAAAATTGSHRAHVQATAEGVRNREQVHNMAVVTGSCGVTASITFTPDATIFSLLFNNFNVVTGTVNGKAVLQQSANCAFRVPITVPRGLTVAARSSHLRGFARSSPQGRAGIAWTAAIGSNLDPNAWADVFNTGSYSARYWSGGVSSGADFDPLTVNMELDSQNPTFAPCVAGCPTCNHFYEVPVDFQFTLTAQRTLSESVAGPNSAQSLIYLDSQDTVKTISMSQPLAFETC